MKILVTGATGTTGTELVKQLVAEGHEVRALVHAPEKSERAASLGAEPAIGDLLDPSTLRLAFAGVDTVYGLAPVSREEGQMGFNMLDAAKAAGVKRFVYHSASGVDRRTGIPFYETKARIEEELRNSGLTWTILRNHYFMQNLLGLKDSILAGVFPHPIGEACLRTADVRDIAAVATVCLTREGHAGHIYQVAGPEALSGHDMAEAFSKALGKPVRYQMLSTPEWSEGALKMGYPEWIVHDFGIMYDYFQRHDVSGGPSDVAGVTGRPPRSFAEFTRELAAKWRAEAAA